MADNGVGVSENGSFLVYYRPGTGEGGQRDMSTGPLVVLTAILRENLALSELSVCSAGFFKSLQ